MKSHLSLVLTVVATVCCGSCLAFSAPSPMRRSMLATPALVVVAPKISQAFDGSGTSAYSGRNLLDKATKIKGYKERITADVKDFNALGAAIDNGELEGRAWMSVFTQYQRREADPVGRTYAAEIDLLGADRSGGAALLLVNTFAKPNKPPDNLPQYKKYTALSKTFEPINAAAKTGDPTKAKKAWLKAAEALSTYLESVEMPSDLSDPSYK
mmetsp:Transcript_26740/g.50474  ORF Transcript_26740/g.50474 Transcript_26740/m.50474 type:complete len:212 (-) Transcript_26740:93-728(-)|eukprot:scaffold9178_cov176-Amphora_coffeaeformis.AAC.12